MLPWVWPFLFTHGSNMPSAHAGEDVLRAHMTPWFLLDPPEVEAARREQEDLARMEALRQVEEEARRQVPDRDELPHVPAAVAKSTLTPTTAPGAKRSVPRRPRKTAGVGELLQADLQIMQQRRDTHQALNERLSALCADVTPIPVSIIDDLKVILQEAKDAGIADDEPIVQSALRKWEETERLREQLRDELLRTYSTRPLEDTQLRSVLKRAHDAGVPPDSAELESASRLLREVVAAQAPLRDCLKSPFPDVLALRKAIKTANELQLKDPALVSASKKLGEAEGEEAAFAGEVKRRWGSVEGGRLVFSSTTWRAAPQSSGLPSAPATKQAAEKALTSLATGGDRKSIDAAIEAFERLENICESELSPNSVRVWRTRAHAC